MSEHLEHEPYLHAVADAVTTRSIEVDDVVAHPDDPRDGYIALGPRSGHTVGAGEDDVFVLGWSEETGWDCGLDRNGRGRVQNLYEPSPPLPVLAAPFQVADWCRMMLTDGIAAHSRMAHGSKHRRQDDTDTAFEDALAAYATPHT